MPAILIGLLAMHALTTVGMSESGGPHAMVTYSVENVLVHSTHGTAVAMSPGMPTPTKDCGGKCGPSHEMLGLICVLALLVTVMLLTLHLILVRWQELRRIVIALAAKAAALARPAPPSLHVLSISRT